MWTRCGRCLLAKICPLCIPRDAYTIFLIWSSCASPVRAAVSHDPSPLQAGDSAIIVGEIAGDALRNLESQLSEVYGRHIAERTDWGSVDDEFKAELEAELKRASASIAETRRGLVGGLDLTHLDASVDLDELLKASMQRAKTKKLPLEPEQMAILQSACLCEQ